MRQLNLALSMFISTLKLNTQVETTLYLVLYKAINEQFCSFLDVPVHKIAFNGKLSFIHLFAYYLRCIMLRPIWRKRVEQSLHTGFSCALVIKEFYSSKAVVNRISSHPVEIFYLSYRHICFYTYQGANFLNLGDKIRIFIPVCNLAS